MFEEEGGKRRSEKGEEERKKEKGKEKRKKEKKRRAASVTPEGINRTRRVKAQLESPPKWSVIWHT